jgi:LPS-assembly lipoprotein
MKLHQSLETLDISRLAIGFAAGLALVLLTACGFAARGASPLPFDALYMSMPENAKFTADLRRAVKASSPDTRIAESAKQAQAILQQVANTRGLRQVSLNPQGRIEELELSIHFVFRLIDGQGNAIVPDTTLTAYRQMPYDDQALQAKSGQMDVLYASMEQSLVNRVLRRLTADDVRNVYARLQRGEVDPNAPVFNPAETYPADGPPGDRSSWIPLGSLND